jgi:hypothetical protein
MHRENKKCIAIFVEKSRGKRQLGRPRRKWAKRIKIDLREIKLKDVNWVYLAQDSD